jgi:hypothetical protein
MSALPPLATLIAYARCVAPATVHLLYLGRQPYINGMVLRSLGRGRPLNAPAAFIHPCQPIVAKQPRPGQGGRIELKNLRRYALLCLATGAKISGSDTDLMSEFSVRYLRY